MSKIVGRTLDFLELFADQRRPLSLSDISRLLKIPVSSCHDVLHALVSRGYLYETAPRAGYYPTLRLFDMAEVIRAYDPVVLRADRVLRELRDKADETVLLAKVWGTEASYLLIFDPAHQLRYGARPGDLVRPKHATSAGKAVLASVPGDELEAALDALKLAPLTARTLTSKAELMDDIAISLERGWFQSNGESLEGVTSIAERFQWGDAVYIVSIGGTTPRMEPKLDRLIGLLHESCRAMEMRLVRESAAHAA